MPARTAPSASRNSPPSTLGLARAAAERGVAIGEHARVTRISREGRTWLLSYEGGSLRAENVLICTNAYTGNLWPVLHRTVIPVRSYQIFTKPLSAASASSVFRGISGYSDSRRIIKGARLHADRRLQFSSELPSFGVERQPDVAAEKERVLKLFPGISELEIEGWWSGWVTRGIGDGWRIHHLGPGLVTAIGCNGRGLALGPLIGKEMIRLLNGTHADELVFPLSSPKPIFGHVFHRPVAAALARYYLWRDRREFRSAPSAGR